ncbi:MAG: DUF308 domain-containing protein [Brevundimonas sp.]|nr:MAG: DUF308 domain-containing protein [Brevundimonas sp.]
MSDNIFERAGRGIRVFSGFYGVLMIILGIAALALPMVSTIAVVLVVGLALFAGGIVGFVASFSEAKGWGILLNILWSLLAMGTGVYILMNPGVGAVSLTMVLGAVLMARGAMSLVLAFDKSFGSSRIWLGIGGAIGILLGGIVLFNLMEMSWGLLGTFVGVDFLVSGVTMMIVAMMGKKALS